jgi:hypothetical protein
LCNTYGFSTPTMVTWTRLTVTLYVYCLYVYCLYVYCCLVLNCVHHFLACCTFFRPAPFTFLNWRWTSMAELYFIHHHPMNHIAGRFSSVTVITQQLILWRLVTPSLSR